MKVFEIDFAVNDYQQLNFESEKRGRLPDIQFDGKSLKRRWKTPNMWVYRPKLKVPDLWAISIPGAMVASPEAFSRVGEFFEMAGEVLPIAFKEKTWNLLNVTECVDALNHAKCEWLLTDEGERVYPMKYAFYIPALPESTIFKVPEVSPLLLTHEDKGDPETEFKAACEKHKIKGIKFTLLWSSK